MARFLTGSEADLAEAARLLSIGRLVAIPTETVYGLAADAFNELAVARTFKAKERPTFDPLIVHVAKSWIKGKYPLEQLAAHNLIDEDQITDVMEKRATLLIKAFMPGPLTLLLPKHKRVPDLVTSGLPQVGIRCPAHKLTQALLEKVQLPLSAPSANRFGRISPTEALHVEEELGTKIEAILDGGSSSIGVESTVLDVATLTLLRPGGLPREKIEEVLGEKLVLPARVTSDPHRALSQLSPGMLESHYAPKKTLFLLSTGNATSLPASFLAKPYALLAWHHAKLPVLPENLPPPTRTLSLVTMTNDGKGDGEAPADAGVSAAQNLFKYLRDLDHDAKVEWILVEPCPEKTGLGPAIQDRLFRASTPLERK